MQYKNINTEDLMASRVRQLFLKNSHFGPQIHF